LPVIPDTVSPARETHLNGEYEIEVIGLLVSPALAKGDQIVALPTVVRKLPPLTRKVVGDLADEERVLVGLDLRSRATAPISGDSSTMSMPSTS
jgi:hypothetical protein